MMQETSHLCKAESEEETVYEMGVVLPLAKTARRGFIGCRPAAELGKVLVVACQPCSWPLDLVKHGPNARVQTLKTPTCPSILTRSERYWTPLQAQSCPKKASVDRGH